MVRADVVVDVQSRKKHRNDIYDTLIFVVLRPEPV